MKHSVYLGLGSNVGNSIEYIAEAIRGISRFDRTTVDAVSRVYRTEPVGDVVQNDFLNLAAAVTTGLDLREFHRTIKNLEQAIGRKETVRWGPREIDIDLLLFDDIVESTETLNIPHREINNRKFVLQPLSEIAPDVMHPVFKKTIAQMNAEITDEHAVTCSDQFTSQLLMMINDSITNPTR